MNRVVRLWAFSLFFLATCAFGQRDLGTITGTITDPQGSAVPHAKVTITEDATGLNYTVETSDTGDYVRPALKPGTYTVTAEATGFRRIAQQNVVVSGGDRVGFEIRSFAAKRERQFRGRICDQLRRVVRGNGRPCRHLRQRARTGATPAHRRGRRLQDRRSNAAHSRHLCQARPHT